MKIHQQQEKISAFQYHEALQPVFLSMCDPLFRIGICNFNFIRIYTNGSYINFINNMDYLKLYIENIQNIGDFFSKRFELLMPHQKLYTIFSPIGLNQIEIQKNPILELIYAFNMINGFLIYQLEASEFVDCFCFMGSNDNLQFQQFCLDHFLFLEQFCVYFKNRIQQVLEKKTPCNLFTFDQKFDFNSLNTNREFQENKNFLAPYYNVIKLDHTKIKISKKEWECWRLLALGQTAKTIANQLNIAPRTVEFYIQTLKHKTAIYDKASLARLFYNNFKEWI